MAKSDLGEIMPRRMAGSRTGPQLPRCPAGCWRPWRDVPRAGRPSSGASCRKPPFTTRPHGSEPAGQRPGRGPHACWPQWAPKGIVPPPPAAGARGSEVASPSAGARPRLRCRPRLRRARACGCKVAKPSDLAGGANRVSCARRGVRAKMDRANFRAVFAKATSESGSSEQNRVQICTKRALESSPDVRFSHFYTLQRSLEAKTHATSTERAKMGRANFRAVFAKVACESGSSERKRAQTCTKRASESPPDVRFSHLCTPQRSLEAKTHATSTKNTAKFVRGISAR